MPAPSRETMATMLYGNTGHRDFIGYITLHIHYIALARGALKLFDVK